MFLIPLSMRLSTKFVAMISPDGSKSTIEKNRNSLEISTFLSLSSETKYSADKQEG